MLIKCNITEHLLAKQGFFLAKFFVELVLLNRCKKKMTSLTDRHGAKLRAGSLHGRAGQLQRRQRRSREPTGSQPCGEGRVRAVREREENPGEADPLGPEHCQPPCYEGLAMPRTFPQAQFCRNEVWNQKP